MRRNKLLSVIVPAYKQSRTIKKDLKTINKVLSKGLNDYDYEIICIVDGLVDNTYKEAKSIKSKFIKVFGFPANKGKGYAVRYGIEKSKGNLVSFIDAGQEISPAGIMMLISHLIWYNADVIVGSKRHPVSKVNYPFFRRILSVGYHLMVKLLFGLPLTDTQSGIKIFRRNVVEKVIPQLLVKKYAMDIEFLVAAKCAGFSRIYEAPIEVNFDRTTSRISWGVIRKMLWDTLAVYYRLKIGYYSNKYGKT